MSLTSAVRWAGVGLDQTGSDRTHSGFACVWEPERATGIREAFLGLYFSDSECNECHHTLFDVQTFSSKWVSRDSSIFSCRKLKHCWNIKAWLNFILIFQVQKYNFLCKFDQLQCN